MHPVIANTFGGLSMSYYIRHFLFGLIFPALILFMETTSQHPIQIGMILLLVINTFLYPYSRFVYESVVGFIMGDNVLFVNVFIMMLVKLVTMMLCWGFAIFIAPVGLAYLYYHHSRKSA